jgi:hydroxymethylpyrimidine pyrophosphatase-like HAD family hydrolase
LFGVRQKGEERMKKRAVICDLDGTLCNADHRKHNVEGDKKDWEAFYASLYYDLPNVWCLRLIRAMENIDFEIIFVSGRPEEWRGKTLEWLEIFWCSSGPLFMRKDKDFRQDAIIKEEIYREHIEPKYDVLFCIDDRKQVVDMWRRIGLVCLQCAEGNF